MSSWFKRYPLFLIAVEYKIATKLNNIQILRNSCPLKIWLPEEEEGDTQDYIGTGNFFEEYYIFQMSYHDITSSDSKVLVT